MQALLTVLPMAVVMSAGPQIVTAIFLATSLRREAELARIPLGDRGGDDDRRVRSFYLLGFGVVAREEDSEKNWLDWTDHRPARRARVARSTPRRKETHPPKWMGKVETARMHDSP